MRILLVIAVFVLGITLGYVVGINQTDSAELSFNQKQEQTKMDDEEDSNHGHHNNHNHSTETNHDSVIDTLDEMAVNIDSSDVSISIEKMIRSVQYPIIYLAEEETAGDSTMAEMLGIEEVQNSSIFVEFWESPLNFEGYKLTKKKLVVYGLSPQLDYKMYKEGDAYFLSYQNVYYKMKETQDFLPFTQVSKQDVFND